MSVPMMGNVHSLYDIRVHYSNRIVFRTHLDRTSTENMAQSAQNVLRVGGDKIAFSPSHLLSRK